ncbi:MAG: fatty acyl-AMP ligase, partial [Gammaproteobacteria bacterium]|nr:fatty acyl-AMP ligase [Gammaproteobacteria bacterium]
AEPVRPDTYNAFIEHFQPIGLNPQAYFSAYGLAEFSLAVSNYGKKILHLNSDSLAQNKVVPVIDSAEQTPSRALMSCGVLLGDTQVMIADPNSNQTMENNEIGEICITGKSKCKGYWNQPERTKDIFEAKLEGSEAQWLRTGDLGFVYDNELFICGRTKDMIIVRGLNYYPHDIELIVEQL